MPRQRVERRIRKDRPVLVGLLSAYLVQVNRERVQISFGHQAAHHPQMLPEIMPQLTCLLYVAVQRGVLAGDGARDAVKLLDQKRQQKQQEQ